VCVRERASERTKVNGREGKQKNEGVSTRDTQKNTHKHTHGGGDETKEKDRLKMTHSHTSI